MGNRNNVVIHDPYTDTPVWLYTHWTGHTLHEDVAAALERGRDRWNDPPYLARIIFNEMTRGREDGTTGFGIATAQVDQDPSNEQVQVYVDYSDGSVVHGDFNGTFQEFIDHVKEQSNDTP